MRQARLVPPEVAWLAVALAAAATLGAAETVPLLSGRVNDYAGMLGTEARARIEEKLGRLEQATTAQLAILTVQSLDGETVDDFAIRVAEAWKLGQTGKDNGVLFLIARQERRMKLEVGYGLESVLTDALCRRILDETVTPRFKASDFDGGVEAAVDVIAARLEGREAPLPASGRDAFRRASLPQRLGAAAIVTIVLGIFSLLALVLPGAPGWVLYAFLIPFHAVFPAALIHPAAGVVLVIVWIVLIPILRILLHRTFLRGRSPLRRAALGQWLTATRGAGSRSGRGGGGWVSGGGFSGGGGSFGGGGASGGW
jgi:uncharacterized protein